MTKEQTEGDDLLFEVLLSLNIRQLTYKTSDIDNISSICYLCITYSFTPENKRDPQIVLTGIYVKGLSFTFPLHVNKIRSSCIS